MRDARRFLDPLTEDQIERWVEKMIDRLDKMFLGGMFDQADYDKQMAQIHQWAAEELRHAAKGG